MWYFYWIRFRLLFHSGFFCASYSGLPNVCHPTADVHQKRRLGTRWHRACRRQLPRKIQLAMPLESAKIFENKTNIYSLKPRLTITSLRRCWDVRIAVLQFYHKFSASLSLILSQSEFTNKNWLQTSSWSRINTFNSEVKCYNSGTLNLPPQNNSLHKKKIK